jgi:hypothetical protein
VDSLARALFAVAIYQLNSNRGILSRPDYLRVVFGPRALGDYAELADAS